MFPFRILPALMWLSLTMALPGCSKTAKTTAPPKLGKPPASKPAKAPEPDVLPRMRHVSVDGFSGRLLLTEKEAAGPLTFENHFLEGPSGPLAVDCTDIEDDAELEKALERAYEKKVRNYIITARQICRPEADDHVTHCSPRWVDEIPNEQGLGVYISLKNVEYPFYPDLQPIGSRLHLELEVGANRLHVEPLMVGRLKGLANLVWLAMPLTGEVEAQVREALPTLKFLENLSLTLDASYTGDFAFLRSLRSLESVDLTLDLMEETNLPTAAVEALGGLDRLASLKLTTPALETGVLKALPTLKSLSHLSLHTVEVPPGLITALVALPGLENLSLVFKDVLPIGTDFSGLSALRSLTSLHLGAWEITLDQLATVFKLVDLSSLSLVFGSWPENFDLKQFAVFSKLEHLTLDHLALESVNLVADAVKTLKSFTFQMMPEACVNFVQLKAQHPDLELRVLESGSLRPMTCVVDP